MKKYFCLFLNSFLFFFSTVSAAATQSFADLDYPFKELFKYKFTYSHPVGRSFDGVIGPMTSFYQVDPDNGSISCPNRYETNFAVNASGAISQITNDGLSNTSYLSSSAYYYCYTPAGSSPFSVSFNRVSNAAVTYERKTVSSSTTDLAKHIPGYSSQKEALEHIEILGDVKVSDKKIEIDGYYAIHAKSVGFARGVEISTNRAFLIISDGDVKFDATNAACDWLGILSSLCRALLPSDKNISISNTYILSGGTVSLNSEMVKIGYGVITDNKSNHYQPGVYLDNVKISAGDIEMSSTPLKGILGQLTPLKYRGDSEDNYYVLSTNLISFPLRDLWDFNIQPGLPEVTLSTSGTHATCEQGWVSVTSSDGSVDAVTLTIKSGSGQFVQNGVASATADVLTDGSRVSVMAQGEGAVEIGVSGRDYSCESDCSLDFKESVIRIFPSKNASGGFDSSNNAFYAGKNVQIYMAVIRNSDDDPAVCEAGTFKDGNVNLQLTYNSAVREGLDFVSSSDNSSVASSGGTAVVPDFDGSFYTIPSFRYFDAGSVTLKASGVMDVADVSTDIQIEGEATFRFAPFGIQINVQSTCGSDEECAKVTALSEDEKYLAGQSFNAVYIPKAYCSEGESGKSEDLANCRTVPSYGYDQDHTQLIFVRAENIRDDSAEKGNFISPNTLNLNQHGSDEASGSVSSDGSTLRVSDISDVGEYDITVDEYSDTLSGLTVARSTLRLPGYVAPYDFEFKPYSSAQPQIQNSCRAASADQLSFTYFGQPVAPRLYVTARSKSGSVTGFFDRTHYPLIDRYSLQAEIFTSSSGSYTPLYNTINGVKSRRIVHCSGCGDPVLADSWSGGVLYLNATDSELLAAGADSTAATPYHYRILAKGYTPALEGAERIYDYRSEAPRYDGTSWNRFYVFMSLGVREETDSDGVYRSVHASDEVGSLDFSYTDLEGRTAAAALYKRNPLEMRMGRLALSNARVAPASNLFMPVTAEFYRTVVKNDAVASQGWVTNTDDSCTVLSRDAFFIEPFGDAGKTVYLKNGLSVDYGNGMKSEKAELVSSRDNSAEASDRTVAQNGLMYLRISRPVPKSSGGASKTVMFQLRDCSVGRNYSLEPGTSFVPVRDISGIDPVSAGPYWLGTSLEGIDQAQGAFRAWPGNDRVLYRLDTFGQ